MKMKLNQSKLKLALVSAIVAGSMGLSATSYAATATGTMAVSTSVLMSCTISAGAMTFASYDPTASADNDATATITSTCTTGGAAVITMSEGGRAQVGSTAAIPLRAMFNGAKVRQKLCFTICIVIAPAELYGEIPLKQVKRSLQTAPRRLLQPMAGFLRTKQVTAGTFNDSVAVTLTY